MSFDDGLILGLTLGAGTSDTDIPDPDYPLWQTLPEPADNGSVFVLRITDPTQQVRINFKYENTNIDYAVEIDWGDGEKTSIVNELYLDQLAYHTYAAANDYIVTVSVENFDNIKAWYPICLYTDYNKAYDNHWLMGKYGENALLERGFSSGFYEISRKEKLKYLKISSQTVLAGGFFDGCRALRKIDYDKAVESIPVNTFRNCSALRFDWDATHLKTIESSAFNNNYALTKLDLPACEQVGNNAFQNCFALQTVILPICSTINDSAFTDCRYLQKVDAPNCTTVGASGFAHNYNLLSVQFAEGCTFGGGAFSNCYSLYPIPTS
jgi:hypothetical protein